jgi:hypothetical protein
MCRGRGGCVAVASGDAELAVVVGNRRQGLRRAELDREDDGPTCQLDGWGRRLGWGLVEFAGVDAGGERGPCCGGELQRGPGGILAVPYGAVTA